MFTKIKDWFRSVTMFGQYLQDEKRINRNLDEMRSDCVIDGYKLDIYTDIKNDVGDFKKEISAYVGSRTYTFSGYSSVKILAEIRLSLGC